MQNHDVINGACGIAQWSAMLHHKHIGSSFVLHRFHASQPCQGGFHVARSTPLAHHAADFDDGGLSVIVEYACFGIYPDVFK